MEKKKRPWQRPQLKQVKLNIDEAVLGICKASPTDTTGRTGRGCSTSGCRATIGS
jgi:hypothetical protein